ncbi:hypothetical protein KC367_g202 [Hortaea werneckii]|nr:hypothetical protein KC367_g202 [Hortaea werneckii]
MLSSTLRPPHSRDRLLRRNGRIDRDLVRIPRELDDGFGSGRRVRACAFAELLGRCVGNGGDVSRRRRRSSSTLFGKW